MIVLGDSTFEIKAAENLGEHFQNSFIKTIKFRPVPKLDELTMQLQIVSKNFEQIYNLAKNMKVKLMKTQDNKITKD